MSGAGVPYLVLCVDDEELLLDLCRLFLERSGVLKVDTATSAVTALEILKEKEYDAIISDYEMPGMNGVEFLKKIRALDGLIPFIMFTGRGREEVVIDALNNGADFYLQKGGEPKSQFAELKSKVEYAIRQKQAENLLKQEREQLLSIFDSLEQIVYVTDPHTYEILYVNKNFQKFLRKEVIGKTCYEEFQNLKEPCSFCTNKEIIERKPLPCIWNYYNSYYDRHFSIVDRIINWPDGREVRLEVATDITEEKRTYEELNAAYEELASSENELKLQFQELMESREKLKESEERYRTVVENSQDIFYRSDAQGNLVMVSPSVLPIYGADSLDELLGKDIASVFYKNPSDREKFLQTLYEKGSVYNYEILLEKKDGTPIWISVNAHFYYDADGKTAGVEGNIRDITKIKMAVNALRESEELYRFLVDHIEDGVFIVQDDLLVYCNNTYAKMIGYEVEEILGTIMYDHISPETRDVLISKCYHASVPSVVLESSEIQLMHKDNVTKIPVLLSLSLGEYKGERACIGTVHHVEEICLRIEDSLRESRAILSSILKESPVPQFVIDTNHVVIHWNDALSAFSGISPDDIIGTNKHWRAFYPQPRPCIADLILDGKTDELEKWYGDKARPSSFIKDAWSSTDFFPNLGENGKWLHYTGALLRNVNGEVWGALETLEDITEQIMNEEGLQAAIKKLNLLSDITRHDILNTLTVLNGAVDIIRDECEEFEDRPILPYLVPVDKALDTIHRQILFTRDYQNLGIKAPLWQSLHELIEEEIVHILSPGVNFHQEETGYLIFADSMFGRVLANLVDNTLRHGGVVTRVNVSTQVKDEALHVFYSDNGKGIVDSLKERIFERGFGSHTGYGLFLIREILSITNISIRETGKPGEGAVFEMIIPSGFFKRDDN